MREQHLRHPTQTTLITGSFVISALYPIVVYIGNELIVRCYLFAAGLSTVAIGVIVARGYPLRQLIATYIFGLCVQSLAAAVEIISVHPDLMNFIHVVNHLILIVSVLSVSEHILTCVGVVVNYYTFFAQLIFVGAHSALTSTPFVDVYCRHYGTHRAFREGNALTVVPISVENPISLWFVETSIFDTLSRHGEGWRANLGRHLDVKRFVRSKMLKLFSVGSLLSLFNGLFHAFTNPALGIGESIVVTCATFCENFTTNVLKVWDERPPRQFAHQTIKELVHIVGWPFAALWTALLSPALLFSAVIFTHWIVRVLVLCLWFSPIPVGFYLWYVMDTLYMNKSVQQAEALINDVRAINTAALNIHAHLELRDTLKRESGDNRESQLVKNCLTIGRLSFDLASSLLLLVGVLFASRETNSLLSSLMNINHRALATTPALAEAINGARTHYTFQQARQSPYAGVTVLFPESLIPYMGKTLHGRNYSIDTHTLEKLSNGQNSDVTGRLIIFLNQDYESLVDELAVCERFEFCIHNSSKTKKNERRRAHRSVNFIRFTYKGCLLLEATWYEAESWLSSFGHVAERGPLTNAKFIKCSSLYVYDFERNLWIYLADNPTAHLLEYRTERATQALSLMLSEDTVPQFVQKFTEQAQVQLNSFSAVTPCTVEVVDSDDEQCEAPGVTVHDDDTGEVTSSTAAGTFTVVAPAVDTRPAVAPSKVVVLEDKDYSYQVIDGDAEYTEEVWSRDGEFNRSFMNLEGHFKRNKGTYLSVAIILAFLLPVVVFLFASIYYVRKGKSASVDLQTPKPVVETIAPQPAVISVPAVKPVSKPKAKKQKAVPVVQEGVPVVAPHKGKPVKKEPVNPKLKPSPPDNLLLARAYSTGMAVIARDKILSDKFAKLSAVPEGKRANKDKRFLLAKLYQTKTFEDLDALVTNDQNWRKHLPGYLREDLEETIGDLRDRKADFAQYQGAYAKTINNYFNPQDVSDAEVYHAMSNPYDEDMMLSAFAVPSGKNDRQVFEDMRLYLKLRKRKGLPKESLSHNLPIDALLARVHKATANVIVDKTVVCHALLCSATPTRPVAASVYHFYEDIPPVLSAVPPLDKCYNIVSLGGACAPPAVPVKFTTSALGDFAQYPLPSSFANGETLPAKFLVALGERHVKLSKDQKFSGTLVRPNGGQTPCQFKIGYDAHKRIVIVHNATTTGGDCGLALITSDTRLVNEPRVIGIHFRGGNAIQSADVLGGDPDTVGWNSAVPFPSDFVGGLN